MKTVGNCKPRRRGTKQSQLIALLKQSDGATIVEIAKALEWLPHTVRGAIAGALKKKLGLKVDFEKVDSARGWAYPHRQISARCREAGGRTRARPPAFRSPA